jgi:hypothetical protein
MGAVLRLIDNTNPVSRAAFFWGLVVFLPVGMNYLALFMLLGAVLFLNDSK